ncbi:uncharacterized protein LOC111700485 isoform X3 [Eurytemora carolleeae]|uniref:uncharacterized protein LOC111700485 isoform X3 n=1 Tax=Eurytemora carolleeae TaxID=1294199 RepID=UPI000C78F431|nr:uncharacterized protein LOC111700485 isoform X3 [Eurytemora carolleeae]|eukprot:XP_023327181.1 uncharacterized protein LOC111700485 isoform X3 [Eurytemora affinis]
MASMHMFILFGLVWLSVEQETCPPHVGQFVTLNNRPYQKEPIVVKVKKKKGETVGRLRVEDNAYYGSPKCSILEDVKTNLYSNFRVREEYDAQTFKRGKDCVIYLSQDKFIENEVDMTILLIADVRPGLPDECQVIVSARASFTVQFCANDDWSCYEKASSADIEGVLDDDRIQFSEDRQIETKVLAPSGGVVEKGSNSTQLAGISLSSSSSTSTTQQVIYILLGILGILLLIVLCCLCARCIQKGSEEKNASMPPSPSPAVKLRQAVKEEEASRIRRQTKHSKPSQQLQGFNNQDRQEYKGYNNQDRQDYQGYNNQEGQEYPGYNNQEGQKYPGYNNHNRQEYQGYLNQDGYQDQFVVMPKNQRVFRVIDEDDYTMPGYVSRSRGGEEGEGGGYSLNILNLEGLDSLGSSYNSRYSRHSYEKQWNNGNGLSDSDNSHRSYRSYRSDRSNNTATSYIEQDELKNARMMRGVQTDAVLDSKNIQTDLDRTETIIPDLYRIKEDPEQENQDREVSAQVNTEITGGYGDREENNESLNPEDLEQSVIMEMQDDNDSENSLNASFVTDSLGLSFESENSWDMMDHEPGPDIPVKETKASLMRKRKTTMMNKDNAHVHCHYPKKH